MEFKIYGSSSRSLKKRVLSVAGNGRVSARSRDCVSVRALDDISLEIDDGARIGLVGHNGAGKSTLLRTIAGIYKPTAGFIDIQGTVGTLIDPAAGMDIEATGYENIFLRGYVLGLKKSEIEARIREIAEVSELEDFLHLPVKTYSAGMFARLGFAISTSIAPSILLIDEGIGAGDAQFQAKAMKRVRELVDRCRIVVLSTHNAALLDMLGCTLIEMRAGKLVGPEAGAAAA